MERLQRPWTYHSKIIKWNVTIFRFQEAKLHSKVDKLIFCQCFRESLHYVNKSKIENIITCSIVPHLHQKQGEGMIQDAFVLIAA